MSLSLDLELPLPFEFESLTALLARLMRLILTLLNIRQPKDIAPCRCRPDLLTLRLELAS